MNQVNPQSTLKILKRAVQLDIDNRYTEALSCYEKGIELTADILRVGKSMESIIKPLRDKQEQYVVRIEFLRMFIAKRKLHEQYSEELKIEEDSTGYSYQSLFGRFLNEDVKFIFIEDVYFKTYDQCQNLLRLCELFVQNCPNLKYIALVTSIAKPVEGDQTTWFGIIKDELLKRKIKLAINYSNDFQEMGLTLSTGWSIQLSRGLDIYKPLKNKFSLGFSELDFRPCYESTVNISHANTFKTARHLSLQDSFYSYIYSLRSTK